MAHVVAWEAVHGPLPEGWHVHHKDEDKQNNEPDNLEAMDALTHKRIHSGCVLRDGVWFKPCATCSKFKPATAEHWYLSRGWINGRICRPCFIAKQVRLKQERRALARQVAAHE